MPDGCGPGSYSVLHALRPAEDNSLPHHVARSTPADPRVFDAEISYDFGLAKRDSGDIYVRIDYSNSQGYWDSIVQGDPVTSKSKRAASPLSKRFYSAAESDWKKKFDELRKSDHPGSGLPNPTLGQGTIRKNSFDVLLTGESPEKCSAKRDDGYLKIDMSGFLQEELEFGYTFVGTISPTFKIEEAYGYYDTRLNMNAKLNFNGKGHLSVPEGMAFAELFKSPVSAWGFSHPGICDFGPQITSAVQMTGQGDINGDFSTNFVIGNDGVVRDSLPKSTTPSDHSGGVSNILFTDAFSGKLTLPSSSKGRRRSTADGDTVLALHFLTTSEMKLNIDFYGQKEHAAAAQFNQTIDSYLRINRQTDGSPRVVFHNRYAAVESLTEGDLPWGDDDAQNVVGRGNALIFHDGAETPADREAPHVDGYALFGGHRLMTCSNSRGGSTASRNCLCMTAMNRLDDGLDLDPETGEKYKTKRRRRSTGQMSDLRELDPSLDLDPETGKPYEQGPHGDVLVPRTITYGAPVPYTVHPPSGNNWQITMNRYPNGQDGDSLLQANPNAGRYGAADCYDCENVGISSSTDDPDFRPVSEHIHERQTEARAQEYMMTGRAVLATRSVVDSSYSVVPERYLDPNSYLFQPYSQWDPNGPYTANGRPIDEITNAYGSDVNPGVMVNADSVLNGYKARIWVGRQPVSDQAWISRGFNRPDHQLADEAITSIRTTMQVFAYLNEPQVNDNWCRVVNDISAIYGRYQERVLAVDGVRLHAREMYQEVGS
ncbi:hypothetical protein CDD83_6593 [Cordyceps sp. RAO-2017]|nr:hypothetical protein CDD83_6593 [Cordyceps sp. RAO-2017]